MWCVGYVEGSKSPPSFIEGTNRFIDKVYTTFTHPINKIYLEN